MKIKIPIKSWIKGIVLFLLILLNISCSRETVEPNLPKSVQFVNHFFDNLGWAFLVALAITIISVFIKAKKQK